MSNNLITLEEAKIIELDILKYLDNVCTKIGIKYYIAYGTLIGAVRHKGFIPWDDDIDVWLFREDYDCLLEYLKVHNNGVYKVLSSKDDGYYISYAKLVDKRTTMSENNYPDIPEYGLFIDIFPLDYVPNNTILRTVLFHIIRNLTTAKSMSLEIEYMGKAKGIKLLIRNILRFAFRLFGYKFFLDSIELIKELFLRKKTKQVSMVYSSSPIPIYGIEDFENGVLLDFENVKFNAPINYDKILRLIYGDYLELPPLEKRISNHNFVDCKYK